MSKRRSFPENTCCIINPNAANKKWKRRKLYRKYFQSIFPVKIVDRQQNKAQTIQAAQDMCSQFDVIVAAGGDGTIADVLQGIINSGKNKKITLGIIPMGSGNAFGKSFGISKSLKKNVKLIAKGKSRPIDLIKIEEKIAAFGSIGATARTVKRKLERKIPGFFGHVIASFYSFRKKRTNMDIELFEGQDDSGELFAHKTLKLKILDCVVGKTKHFGYGWRVAPEAKIDDGYIDVTLFEITGLQYLLVFPAIYLGLYQKTQRHFKAKKVIIQGKELPLQYNGEFLGVKNKIEMIVLPSAIKIICPDKMPH